MTAMTFSTPDEVHNHLGKTIGPGAWVTVDQARIDTFAAVTGDHQWIHTDPARAASGPYGSTIAHGYLTLSLLPGLTPELYVLAFGSARVNYGCNKVRYLAPVPAGSRVRATAMLVESSSTAKGTLVTVRFTVEVEGGRTPALVAETLTLVVP